MGKLSYGLPIVSQLSQLRSQLESIDSQIIQLVAKRQDLAKEIGEYKLQEGLATRDFTRETVLIKRNSTLAESVGLSSQTAEELTLLLIRESLIRQEQDRLIAEEKGHGQRVLIIGGSGQMGQWFAQFLHTQGYEIEIVDPSQNHTPWKKYSDFEKTPDDFSIVLVATPISKTNDILLQIATRGTSATVVDVTSLKTPLRTGFQALKAAGISTTSLHPMFGPATQLLSKRHVLAVNLGDDEALKTACKLFESTSATLIETTLDEHDRLIAYVLGLSHATNIAFFSALAESGETAEKLAQLSSTTFDAQLDVATRVAQESPQLYFEIQQLNEYGQESLDALIAAVGKLRAAVAENQAESFYGLMTHGKSYLDKRIIR